MNEPLIHRVNSNKSKILILAISICTVSYGLGMNFHYYDMKQFNNGLIKTTCYDIDYYRTEINMTILGKLYKEDRRIVMDPNNYLKSRGEYYKCYWNACYNNNAYMYYYKNNISTYRYCNNKNSMVNNKEIYLHKKKFPDSVTLTLIVWYLLTMMLLIYLVRKFPDNY